jgi:hypothetical protein
VTGRDLIWNKENLEKAYEGVALGLPFWCNEKIGKKQSFSGKNYQYLLVHQNVLTFQGPW